METTELTGEALAAEVATKVMGWTTDGESWCDATGAIVHLFTFYFRPDRDIAQAWEVVERMRSMGYVVRMSDKVSPGLWWCYLSLNDEMDETDPIEGIGQAETAPLAISRAALAAMEAR